MTIEELEKMPLAEILDGKHKGKFGIITGEKNKKICLDIYYMIPTCPDQRIEIELDKVRIINR